MKTRDHGGDDAMGSGTGKRRRSAPDDIDATKTCPACGLPFSNRKKWASRGLWPSIVYCSERCRRSKGRTPRD